MVSAIFGYTNTKGVKLMLALVLRKICEQRGHLITPRPDWPFMIIGHADGSEIILQWDESKLGPRPTQAEIDAVDAVALKAEIAAAEAAEKARQEWMKTAKSEVDSLKVQKADKAVMESMQKAIADKDSLISKLSTDVATLTTQLAATNTKLSELDQLKADVAALKVAKVEPTK